MFNTNISETSGDQTILQFSTAPIVCFCTTWENQRNIAFCPITPSC